MKKIDLGQVITILANIAVLTGIVFLGIEIRQTRLAILDSNHLGSIEYSAALTERIYMPEFAEIYDTGLDNYDELSRAERLMFDSYVGQRINLWEYAFWIDQRGTATPQTLANWDAYFRTQMAYKGWQQNWAERRTRQDDAFTAHVEQVLSGE